MGLDEYGLPREKYASSSRERVQHVNGIQIWQSDAHIEVNTFKFATWPLHTDSPWTHQQFSLDSNCSTVNIRTQAVSDVDKEKMCFTMSKRIFLGLQVSLIFVYL